LDDRTDIATGDGRFLGGGPEESLYVDLNFLVAGIGLKDGEIGESVVAD